MSNTGVRLNRKRKQPTRYTDSRREWQKNWDSEGEEENKQEKEKEGDEKEETGEQEEGRRGSEKKQRRDKIQKEQGKEEDVGQQEKKKRKILHKEQEKIKIEDNKQSRASRGQELREWIEECRNPNTKATYESGWKRFIRFIEEEENPKRKKGEEVDLERPDEESIAHYIKKMVDRGSTMASVNTALGTIAAKLTFQITTEYNPTNSRLVKKTAEILTPMAAPTTKKINLTAGQVKQIEEIAEGEGNFVGERDALMFSCAFQLLLRASEVVRLKVKDFKEEREIRINDVKRTMMDIEINRASKNGEKDVTGHMRAIISHQGTEKENPCIIKRIKGFMSRWKDIITKEGWMFPKETGEQMSVDTPNGRLKYRLKQMGWLNHGAYGFHSFRAGGATEAIRAGVDIRLVKAQGNWKSNAAEGYVRPGDGERTAVSRALAGEKLEKRAKPTRTY
jgi:integrase